ncbi:hypothetical protein BGX38DRAFT_1281746 [Terfezia claveryi]|nr:hypothetical protein BGX38DRAFT_1281746 [Terfezia claveryi]
MSNDPRNKTRPTVQHHSTSPYSSSEDNVPINQGVCSHNTPLPSTNDPFMSSSGDGDAPLPSTNDPFMSSSGDGDAPLPTNNYVSAGPDISRTEHDPVPSSSTQIQSTNRVRDPRPDSVNKTCCRHSLISTSSIRIAGVKLAGFLEEFSDCIILMDDKIGQSATIHKAYLDSLSATTCEEMGLSIPALHEKVRYDLINDMHVKSMALESRGGTS